MTVFDVFDVFDVWHSRDRIIKVQWEFSTMNWDSSITDIEFNQRISDIPKGILQNFVID